MKRYRASLRTFLGASLEASFKASVRAFFRVSRRAVSRAYSKARPAALFCAVLLCAICLTSCAQSGDGPAGPAMPEPPSVLQSSSAAQNALPFSVGTLYPLSWGSSEGGYRGCSSGTAYYNIVQSNVFVDDAGTQWEDWLILCTDFETRVQSPLCSVPGCAHTDDSCPAFLRSRSNMENFYIELINGQLYVLRNYWFELVQHSDADDAPAVWLEKAAMDGSGRTRLMELPPKWQLSDPFLLTDGTALYGQYGDNTDGSWGGIRVELESGDYTTFSFGLNAGERLTGAVDSRFILSRSNDVFPQLAYPQVTGGYEMYRLPSFSSLSQSANEMELFDPALGTRRRLNELLPPPVQDESLYRTFFQQGKYYCNTGNSPGEPQALWQIDFAANTSRVLAQRDPGADQSWWTIQSLTLFPSTSGIEEPYVWGSRWVNRENYSFLIDVRDGAILPIALRYRQAYHGTAGVDPLAQTNDGLWLVQTQEVPTDYGRYRFFYALAAPETVLSGEGELYPIQMWGFETPLG